MRFDAYDTPPSSSDVPARRYIGVLFECCGVYARIYRRPDERVYRGCCPRCLRQLEVPVGTHGTKQRIFRAR